MTAFIVLALDTGPDQMPHLWDWTTLIDNPASVAVIAHTNTEDHNTDTAALTHLATTLTTIAKDNQ